MSLTAPRSHSPNLKSVSTSCLLPGLVEDTAKGGGSGRGSEVESRNGNPVPRPQSHPNLWVPQALEPWSVR